MSCQRHLRLRHAHDPIVLRARRRGADGLEVLGVDSRLRGVAELAVRVLDPDDLPLLHRLVQERLVVVGGTAVAARHHGCQLVDITCRIEPGLVLLHVGDDAARLFRHVSTLRLFIPHN